MEQFHLQEQKSTEQGLLNEHEAPVKIKLYRKRWVILTIYIVYAAINDLQWFEYSVIANIVMRYYGVSALAVDWTSIIYMALYMPMVIPASYFIDKKGLRVTAIVGAIGTALGTLVKVLSLNQNNMWVVYLGQTILSSMQVFILSIPPKIAAVWFGEKEVSRACALGVFGTQLGAAIGFILPPMLVKNHNNLDYIRTEFAYLISGLAIISVASALSVIFYFSKEPKLPPSKAQYVERTKNSESASGFKESLVALLKNKAYVMQIFAYGINIGCFVAVSTLLNQIVLSFFPNSEEDCGRIGLLMIVLGMFGSVIFGYILDKTHKFKETSVAVYLASVLGLAATIFALKWNSKLLLYLSSAVFGLFCNTYMAVGLDYGTKLSHPEPESTASGLLVSMTQTLGVVFTLLLGWLLRASGPLLAITVMTLILFSGVVITVFIPRKNLDFLSVDNNKV